MLSVDDLNGGIEGLLQQLVRILNMDLLENEGRIADFVRGFLEGAEIKSACIPLEPGRSSIVVRIPDKSSGSIILCGHLDGVGRAAEWHIPLFFGEMRGG